MCRAGKNTRRWCPGCCAYNSASSATKPPDLYCPNLLHHSGSYDSMEPELHKARLRARAWAHKFNNYFPVDTEAKPGAEEKPHLAMLREILGHVEGEHCFIEAPFRIDYGCNIRLGDCFYANFNLTVLDCGIVTIGDRVMCGPNVSIYAATHEVEVQSRRDNIEYALPVTHRRGLHHRRRLHRHQGHPCLERCERVARQGIQAGDAGWEAIGRPARIRK
ncbi:trimeric LpxA-like protein [Thozetella sp. PMI_491]|nr:trimeric LpxA-like protein [Thozetella sp. PMI_491]